MADNAAADSGVEDDRQLADRRLAGVQPRNRARAGACPDVGDAFEVGQMMRAVPAVIALHVRAFARDDARRQAVPARPITAKEAVTGSEREARPAVACAAALAVGDSGDGACGLLDAKRGFAQRLRIGFAADVEIEVGTGALEQQFLGRGIGRASCRERVCQYAYI